MKTYFTTLLLVLIVSCSFAQSKFSIGPELAIPGGGNWTGVKIGIGATAAYEGKINQSLNWVASMGYIYFPVKYTDNGSSGVNVDYTGHASFVPIMGGVKFYTNNEAYKAFYVGANIGDVITSATVTTTVSSVSGSGSGSDNRFVFSPNIGYRFSRIDLQACYNVISNGNYLGVRAAIIIP